MLYSKIPLAQLIVKISKRIGFSNVVLSPGSRNAPLIKGFVADPFFQTYSIVDERSAGFFGLGIAQQAQQPVVLSCTSGSALLNYYPAVVEAYYSHIPLVILSADRPHFKVDIGDGQTIRQSGVLSQFTAFSESLAIDVIHAKDEILLNPNQNLIPENITSTGLVALQKEINKKNTLLISEAFQKAIFHKQPIHLNVPFEEPLYEMTSKSTDFPDIKFPSKNQSSEKDYGQLIERWHLSNRKWILLGVCHPNYLDQKILEHISNDESVVILSETTTNRKWNNHVFSIDTLLFPLELLNRSCTNIASPQIIITIGGMIISKKIKSYLRRLKDLEHWHLGENEARDTFYKLSHKIYEPPDKFLSILYSRKISNREFNYRNEVLSQFENFIKAGEKYLQTIPFSDLKAFEIISNLCPDHITIHFANSAVIRYAQLFNWHHSISIFCNRGTSGIEGSTSTAIGASQVSKNPTLLITGDLSFFYDSNGLWNDYVKASFRIILINNCGGGIFRVLPTGSKDTEVFDTYIETTHNRNAKRVAEDAGFIYTLVDTKEDLIEQMKVFFRHTSKPKLMEIKTPRKINDILLLDYFKAMAQKDYFSKKYLQ